MILLLFIYLGDSFWLLYSIIVSWQECKWSLKMMKSDATAAVAVQEPRAKGFYHVQVVVW